MQVSVSGERDEFPLFTRGGVGALPGAIFQGKYNPLPEHYSRRLEIEAKAASEA